MIIGKYKKLDMNKLQPLVDLFLNSDQFVYHKSATHQQHWLGTLETGNFWQDYPELFDYIEKNTYPENEKITGTWFKLYTSNTKLGSATGEFIGLHQDKRYENPVDEDHLIHTTSIMLHRSEDAEGAYTVLAGDDAIDRNLQDRFKDSRDLMSRLLVEDVQEPGQMVVWNGWTMHGVSEMKKGSRLNLIIFKKSKFNEDYFKT